MTAIAAWVACDNHSYPAIYSSAYIISDSRFTIGRYKYDNGRKLFSLKNFPDVMAYCGDVLFPVTTLSQIVELADNGLLFPNNSQSELRSRRIFEQIQIQFSTYPSLCFSNTSIYHIARNEDKTFSAYKYWYSEEREWKYDIIPIQKEYSHLLFCDGSGKDEFSDRLSQYESPRALNVRTSRNIYQCFAQLLLNSRNPTFGGSPQLVGLYRGKGNGINYGIIHNGKRYYLGSPLQELENFNFVRWYNDNFEICDGNTMLRKQNAMRQPNPNIF